MADITNPQAIKFANEKERRMADVLASAYRTAKQFMLDIVDFETISAGNANSDVLIDGSAQDGRKVITKGNVLELKFVIEQVIGALETDDRLQLLNKSVVNGQPIF